MQTGTGCRGAPSILSRCSGHKKSQGHKTRAPEGMSILAFLWISPFLRYPTPLTPNYKCTGVLRVKSKLYYRGLSGYKLPERRPRFHSLETPPVPYFKLLRELMGSKSLRLSGFATSHSPTDTGHIRGQGSFQNLRSPRNSLYALRPL